MASDADLATKALIRDLALRPERVRIDAHATGNMMAWRLTVEDVCDAICDWIDQGERVKPTVVKTHPKALVGMPAHDLSPVPILSGRFYIRLTIYKPDQLQDTLLIVSVHPA